ncbi:SGNH/GDSL hydrolase family protein [Psychrobacter jeotgali]|uniref:SGNH/GDSL hydrolase family protein n=1 Tax=Psychrobacter jeotgali TaxID=179010 RepID=UPI0019186633|nr:SGNH/GDSL hydrolase family protein [Psychrobacter jeotgali]
MVTATNKKTTEQTTLGFKAAATPKVAAIAKDVLLAPIYLYQGHKVKRDTVRLPEPEGERHGSVKLNVTEAANDNLPTFQLMIVGDSSAAGVGSDTQTDALAGKLIPALQQQPAIDSSFAQLDWSLQATTGHTSFDILRRLYVLPTPNEAIDVMILSLGVNDTTANVATETWQQQLEEIIAVAKRKFKVKTLIFSSLPPMAKMPALPSPLNGFIGAKATKLDDILQQVCSEHDGVYYMAADFARMAEEHSNGEPIDGTVMFARDGFHPSSITYGYWALQLSDLIAQLLTNTNNNLSN